MPSARDLYELQKLDQAMEGVRARLAELEPRLGDRSLLNALAKEIEERRAAAKQAQLDQAALDVEVGAKRQKLSEMEQQLYGGSVSNPKELEALQQQHEGFKPRVAADEERLLAAMDAVEDAKVALAQSETALPDAEARWAREQEELARLAGQARAELKVLEARRAAITTRLSPQDIATYDRLRRVRAGVAVAAVERGVCGACHVGMPGHMVQRARGGRELVFCPSCGRILVVS